MTRRSQQSDDCAINNLKDDVMVYNILQAVRQKYKISEMKKAKEANMKVHDAVMFLCIRTFVIFFFLISERIKRSKNFAINVNVKTISYIKFIYN